MRLGTANIQNFPDMSPAAVAADALTVAANTNLCGLQEIQPTEDTPVVMGSLGPHWQVWGKHRECPIAWNTRRWNLQWGNVVPFDRPKLPRPQNRHAGVVSVVLESVDRPHLPPFAVVNTHLVAGGMNGPHLPTIAARWKVEWGMFQDEALRLWRQGLTVFAVGDLNHPRPNKLRPHDSFRWLSPMGTPDHIGVLENLDSVRLAAPHHERKPLNSDHGLHVVSGRMERLD